MTTNFNFTGVEVATSGSKFVEPGFQKLTIVSIAAATAKSGSQGVEVEFSSDKGGTFKQKYWLADASGNVLKKAAPSFQYLVEKFTGAALEGSMTLEALSAKLVGKSHEVTVGGRRYTTEKDGKKYNNTAGWLPFSGWSGETAIRYDGAWDEATPQGDSNVSDDSDGLPF